MRDYPAFIVDRSRRSKASRFTDDFVVCTDQECGFIARAYKVSKSRREETVSALQSSKATFLTKVIGDIMVVVEIVRFLNEPLAHRSRVPSLLKKALRAYFFAEVQDAPLSGADYDEQLAAIDEVIRMADSQRARIVDMSGETAAERFITSLKRARGSVELLKQMVEHGRS